jgi:hypothetical protein
MSPVGLARRARNLEQVGGSGDGITSAFVDDTLKTAGTASVLASCGGKDRDGERHERRIRGTGPAANEQSLEEEETEEGSERCRG